MKNIGKSKRLTERTGYLISRIATLMQLSFDRRLKPFGVTRSQWMIMSAVYGKDANTAAEIAKILSLDATAVTRLVDRLEDKGLVKRIHDATDRRINRIELTEEGQRLSPILKKEADKNYDFIFGVLSESEQKHLKELLAKIMEHLSSS